MAAQIINTQRVHRGDGPSWESFETAVLIKIAFRAFPPVSSQFRESHAREVAPLMKIDIVRSCRARCIIARVAFPQYYEGEKEKTDELDREVWRGSAEGRDRQSVTIHQSGKTGRRFSVQRRKLHAQFTDC